MVAGQRLTGRHPASQHFPPYRNPLYVIPWLIADKKKPALRRGGQKYWKQCEQCRTEYLSDSLNYSVLRKIIFIICFINPTFSAAAKKNYFNGDFCQKK